MDERTTAGRAGGRLRHPLTVKLLLLCGAASSALYVATDVFAATHSPGYEFVSQSVSQLLAVGTPMRSFVVPPMTAYNALMAAFGVGVWLAAGSRRALRVTGVLLVLYGIASQLGLTVFPLSLGQTEASSGAGGHMAITAVLVLLMFLFMAVAAIAKGTAFRLYTLITVVAILGGSALTGMQVQRIAETGSAPMAGVLERFGIYATLLWVAVFAIALVRDVQRTSPTSDGTARSNAPGATPVSLTR